MVQTYFPFDSGQGANITEAQWQKMAQHWLTTGVIKSMLNELQVFADSTGMRVKVKSGQAWVKGHFYESDAEEILAIATANATNPRIDRVIIRLDWTANSVVLAVLQGTPAASPVAPALTQNTSRWEISLAQVRVNANVSTIASGNVTDERTFTGQRESSHVEAYQSTGQAVAATTWTKVLYQTEVIDEKGEYDPSLSRFTAKEKGEYLVSATLMSAVSTIDAAVADLLVKVNGGDHVRLWGDTLKINKNTLMAGSTILKLNAGDYVEIYFLVGGMGAGVNPNTAPGALNSVLRIYQIGF